MASIILCLLAFLVTFIAARRSLVAGLVAALAIGYAYGILRANITQTFSHFIFDAAIVGLYIAQLTKRLALESRIKTRKLRLWIAFLIVWPFILFLIPIQDTIVEVVGLRGNIFLLPFLIFGARLKNDDVYRLTLWIAGLNLIAFIFAIAEFFLGVPRFFPENEVTSIIYMGKDIVGYTAFRIPATFTSAHAYAGTMVMSLPLLVGAWLQKHDRQWHRYLLLSSLVVTLLSVFMAAARVHTVVLFLLLIVTTFSIAFSGRLKLISAFGWLLMLIGISWIVSNEERFQRFLTLQDTDYVVDRVAISVNKSFWDLAIGYPLGNGLGGGGTSLPYFLRERVKNPVVMENEYARIMLEQGIPGLCLWIAFILWVFTRRTSNRLDPWHFGRRLAWFCGIAYFTVALIGTGLLTSIPQTCLMLLLTGWIAVPQNLNTSKRVVTPQIEPERRGLAQQYG